MILETINNIIIELYTMMPQNEIEKERKDKKEGIKLALEKGVQFRHKKIEYPKYWGIVVKLVENKTINNIKKWRFYGWRK